MKNLKHRPVHIMMELLAGVICITLASPHVAGQTARPVVATNFVIESPNHKNNFTPATVRHSFELRIAAELARLGHDRFGFLNWTPIDAVTPNTIPVAQLTLSLKAGTGAFPAISLEYKALISGQAHGSGIEPVELFGGFDDQLTSDHSALEAKLMAKIREQFANDSFRRDLQDGLLSEVPLARAVTLQQPQVIIPVDFGDVAPSDQSILLIRFRARPNGATVEGSAELVPLGEDQGALNCLIQNFLSSLVTINTRGGWDPNIAVLTQPPTVETLNVFMRVYKQRSNSGTDGTLATRPE
ncbi:MAG TPA: hypothetical protein VIW67_08660 [Terriglobales bacterium]|jgi:hypothetical protein